MLSLAVAHRLGRACAVAVTTVVSSVSFSGPLDAFMATVIIVLPLRGASAAVVVGTMVKVLPDEDAAVSAKVSALLLWLVRVWV